VRRIHSNDMSRCQLKEIDGIRCEECNRAIDEFTAIKERWGFWSDGCGELLPFCPECARREFAPDVLSSVHHARRPNHEDSS
jgi:hypothetical protein